MAPSTAWIAAVTSGSMSAMTMISAVAVIVVEIPMDAAAVEPVFGAIGNLTDQGERSWRVWWPCRRLAGCVAWWLLNFTQALGLMEA